MSDQCVQGEDRFQTTEQDRNLYCAVMSKVKLRIDEAGRLVWKRGMDERDLIYGAIQLRLAIKEIAYSSFVANRLALQDAARSTRVRKWSEATKVLSAINPSYWPVGVKLVKADGETDRWDTQADQLTEEACAPAWGRLSALLHARNPMLPDFDLAEEAAFAQDLVRKLKATLNEHLVHMVGHDELLCCQMGSDPIRLYIFGRRAD